MFALQFAVLCIILIAGAFLGRRYGKVPAVCIILAAIIPPLLVWTTLAGADRGSRTADSEGGFGDLRFSVHGIAVAGDVLTDGVSIGGDRQKDTIFVPQSVSSQVRFEKMPDGKVGIFVTRSLRAELTSVVSIEDDHPSLRERLFGRTIHFVGEQPITSEFAYCPGGCGATSCKIIIRPRADRLAMAGGPELAKIDWVSDPARRIYPLRFFALPDRSDNTPCTGVIAGGDSVPVTAFLFKPNWLSAAVFGVSLGGGDDSKPDAELTAGGEAKRVRIYRIDFADKERQQESERISRVVERRSLKVSLSPEGNLKIDYDSPEYIHLAAPALSRLIREKFAAGHTKDIVLPIDSDIPAGRPQSGDSTLEFRSLGGRLAQMALGRVLIHPAAASGSLKPFFTVYGGKDVQNLPFGASFEVGKSYVAHLKLLRLGRYDGLLALLTPLFLLGALVAGLTATWRARRATPTGWLLVALAEVLVSLRLLVAISGSYIDPAAQDAGLIPAALIAYLAVPFLVARAAARLTPSWTGAVYAAFVLTVAMLLQAKYDLHLFSAVVGVPLAAVLAVAVTDFLRWLWRLRRAIRMRLSRSRTIPPSPRWKSPHFSLGCFGRLGELPQLWIGLGAVVVSRFVMALAHVKEGVPIAGGRIALSTVYLPLILLILTRMLYLLIRRSGAERERIVHGLMWCGAFVLAFVPVVVAKDTGFVIFTMGLAFVAVFAMAAIQSGTRDLTVWLCVIICFPLGCLLFSHVLVHAYVVKSDWKGPALAAVMAVWAFYLVAHPPAGRFVWLRWIGLAMTSLALVSIFFLAGQLDAALMLVVAIALVAGALCARPVSVWALPAMACLGLALSFQYPGVPQQVNSAYVTDKQQALNQIEDQLQKDQNRLRLWYQLAPNQIEEIGTEEGQSLGAALAHLDDYVSCPKPRWPACLAGHGYLSIPKPTVLAPYHLSDNVSAIHLIAPFGRLGGALFLALIAAVTLLYTAAGVWRGGAIRLGSPRTYFGLATMWTILVPAVYMVLANLQVLPFTGKNIYFLAAASGSDLVEGTLLLVLAAWISRTFEDESRN